MPSTLEFDNQLQRAEQGDLYAQLFVARQYYSDNDWHVTQDFAEAKKWLLRLKEYSASMSDFINTEVNKMLNSLR